jgi:hypothetical protein
VREILRPARLATRAASFRYGGWHHSVMVGGIIPLYPGGFVGIGKHDRSRPSCASAHKTLAKRGRSLIASHLSMFFCRRPESRFSPRSELSAATSGPKHRCCNVHNELPYNDAAQGPPSQPPVPSPGGQPSHPRFRSDGSYELWNQAAVISAARAVTSSAAGSERARGAP